MENQSAELGIKFTGKELPRGTVDLFDLVYTVFATGQIIERIAKNENFLEDRKLKINVVAVKEGSFEIYLIITLACLDATRQFLINSGSINQVKTILTIIENVFKVKKFLKGENPIKIIANQGGKNEITIVNVNAEKLEINIPTYRALQDININSNIKKIVKPLGKEGGNIDAIKFISNKESEAEITKEEYPYFAKEEKLKGNEEFDVRGVVTAYDRKTGRGRITISNGKRINFELEMMHPNLYDRIEGIIIDSLKLKSNLRIKGEVFRDSLSNLQRIKIKEAEQDKSLF